MMGANKLNVVTPWLDRPEFIRDFEHAVQGVGVEVVVVDNGSTAKTEALLREMVDRLGGRFIRNEGNRWFAAACNRGLAAASGEVILFLNNDISAPSSAWLADVERDVLEQRKSLLGPSLMSLAVDGQNTWFLEGWCIAASRDVWLRLGGWDEQTFDMSYWEDADLCVRASMLGIKLARTRWAVHHKGRGTQVAVPAARLAWERNLAAVEALVRGERQPRQAARQDIILPGRAVADAIRLYKNGRLSEAEVLYRELLSREPEHAVAAEMLGVLLHESGRNQEALSPLRQAIHCRPQESDFHNNLGTVLGKLEAHEEAAAAFTEATRLRPGHAAAHLNLGSALRRLRRHDAAVAALQEALRLRPDHPKAHRELASTLGDQGDVDAAIPHLRRAADLEPDNAEVHSDLLFTLLHREGQNPETILAEHRMWAERHAVRHYPLHNEDILAPLVGLTSERRLRIGYVSPDFRYHPVATFLKPLLANHNREVVEVFCYSDVSKPDPMTASMRAAAEHWRDIVGYSDEQALEMIRHDRIDVLVDLAGHTGGNRMRLFARRAAHVQVSYIGYPATTGLATIDYKLTDEWHDPLQWDTDSYFTERLWRLPRCAWAYHPPQELADTPGPGPAAHRGSITFGSFNRLEKVTPEMIGVWSQVLQAVAESRMMLLIGEGGNGEEWARKLFRGHGIDESRIQLVGRLPRPAYFALHRQIDIGLDTFPYNGQTVTCNLLWAGVPTVSLAGRTHVSCAGASVLTAVGLQELIANSPQQFVDVAVALASNLDRLAAIRKELRGRLNSSALRDERELAATIEEAFRQMLARQCLWRGSDNH